MSTDRGVIPPRKLDLSGSVAPQAMPLADMPAWVWQQPESLRSEFHVKSRQFFQCQSVLAVTGIESGISALARLFQTWYGAMRVVLAEPCFEQWDVRFRRASHVVLDWPVEFILEGDIPECDVVVLGRPVNPTGQLVSIEVAQTLAKKLRAQGGWLILDEAYLDWTDHASYCAFIEQTPAIVLRSLAPFSGLAGCNLAFVCSTSTVCQALLEEVGTQAVSSAQTWLALQYFESHPWHQLQKQHLHHQVQRLCQLWQQHLSDDVPVEEGGYFVSFQHPDNPTWAYQLEKNGVLVRLFPGEQEVIRCSIPRSEADWEALEQAISGLSKG